MPLKTTGLYHYLNRLKEKGRSGWGVSGGEGRRVRDVKSDCKRNKRCSPRVASFSFFISLSKLRWNGEGWGFEGYQKGRREEGKGLKGMARKECNKDCRGRFSVSWLFDILRVMLVRESGERVTYRDATDIKSLRDVYTARMQMHRYLKTSLGDSCLEPDWFDEDDAWDDFSLDPGCSRVLLDLRNYYFARSCAVIIIFWCIL